MERETVEAGMTKLPDGYAIETIDDGARAGTPLGDELTGFWTSHGVLDESGARERLSNVICVLRDPEGGVAGTSSAVDASVAQIGNRRFWVLRCFAPTAEARAAVELIIVAAREHLRERVGGDGVRPLGLCMPVADRNLIAERNEATWPRSGMLFAGWTPRGEQLRISYFEGATIL